MGALRNQRQERFVQLVKQGIPPYRAYPQAGYQPHESAPYRLCGNVRVKERMDEITRELAMKTRVTVASITAELDEAAALAKRIDQPSAMTQAIIAKAKLHGLLIERKEAGAPGDFAAARTEAEVLEQVRNDLGEAAAELLGQLLKASVDTTMTQEVRNAKRPAISMTSIVRARD